MSDAVSSTAATAAAADEVYLGQFVDARVSTDKKSTEVTIRCGNCEEQTSAPVPREEYHVVTVGQAVGIFTSGAIADTLINGVEGFARRKVYSWEQAVQLFNLALATGSVQIKPAKEK
ncbi:hypothetical protein H1R20_g749, partial [Candolleomyces eurysporus]